MAYASILCTRLDTRGRVKIKFVILSEAKDLLFAGSAATACFLWTQQTGLNNQRRVAAPGSDTLSWPA